ncbi:MAG TPA: hypothetical protein VMV84_01185 [Dehalococcoidales bacterium]|nr:hypothetical protein [Dehalococcoidales bacterium]
MPDLYIFKAQEGMIDPVALQNQNVAIHYTAAVYYRKVDFLEAIPPFQCLDIGALAAVTASGRVNAVNLEMADHEFGLFRWYPIDDAQIRLYHPAGISKYQLRNIQVPVDMNIVNRDPNLVSTEIAVWEDNRPAFEAVNGHAFVLGAVRIIAIGFRFHTVSLTEGAAKNPALVEALKTGKEPCTHVWCSGRAMGD